MSARDDSSPTLFMVLVVGVLAVTGYLAWHVYQTPQHPDEAGEVATRMTNVTVVAGGGDASVCQELRSFTAEQALDDALDRCSTVAANAAAANGVGWLGIRDLRVTDSDLSRSSGSVTVSAP
jgi:cytochrome c-type biogenesis protein CcmH/NrfG